MKRRGSMLKLGAFLVIAAAIVFGLSVWGLNDGFEWDVQRCARLPDHWSPEFAWALLICPMAFAGLLIGVASVWAEWSTNGGWFSRLFLGLAGVLVVGAAVLAALARFGPCPPVS
ncbi:MAG: hypothetical protein REJ23_12300 [Brevundimonas sp.]|nr:hypothetical protein [Brevundimonas sp.]